MLLKSFKTLGAVFGATILLTASSHAISIGITDAGALAQLNGTSLVIENKDGHSFGIGSPSEIADLMGVISGDFTLNLKSPSSSEPFVHLYNASGFGTLEIGNEFSAMIEASEYRVVLFGGGHRSLRFQLSGASYTSLVEDELSEFAKSINANGGWMTLTFQAYTPSDTGFKATFSGTMAAQSVPDGSAAFQLLLLGGLSIEVLRRRLLAC